MATITITTDTDIEDVTYTNVDTLSVTNSAVLTIKQSPTVPPAYINATDGEILIDPSLSGGVAPLILTLHKVSTNGISAGNNGKLSINGGWHSLGTGDGTAGQTVTFYSTKQCPWVQVETAAGSGIFIDFKLINNIALVGSTAEIGCFYTQSGSTITFGDGTNGHAPPTGSVIRCPDIYIDSDNVGGVTSYTTRQVVQVVSGADGSLTRFHHSQDIRLYGNIATSLLINEVGCVGPVYITQTGNLNIPYLVASPYEGTALHGIQILKSNNMTAGTIDGSSYLTYGVDMQLMSGGVVQKVVSFELNTDSTYDTAVNFANIYDFNVDHLICVGSKVSHTTCTGITIGLVEWSERATGINPVSNAPGSAIYTTNSESIFMNGFSILNGGCPPTQAIYYLSTTRKSRFINFDVPETSGITGYIAAFANVCEDVVVARGRTGTLLNSYSYIHSSDCSKIRVFDVVSETANDDQLDTLIARIEGVTTGVPSYSQGAAKDSPYFVAYDAGVSPTTGMLWLLPCAPNDLSYFTVLSGDPKFNNNSQIGMYTIGDSCEMEIPYDLFGITGFLDSAISLSVSNVDIEYAIRAVGGSYGSFLPLTQTNISAESVSSTLGFRIKFRMTSTLTSASTRFNRLGIPISVDSTYRRPLSIVSTSVTASADITGAEIRVYDLNNVPTGSFGTEIGGTESCTSSTFLFDAEAGNIVLIQIMLDGYEEFTQEYTIPTIGTDFYARMKIDNNS